MMVVTSVTLYETHKMAHLLDTLVIALFRSSSDNYILGYTWKLLPVKPLCISWLKLVFIHEYFVCGKGDGGCRQKFLLIRFIVVLIL